MLIAGTRTLGSALEDKAQRVPDAPFLIFEDDDGQAARWTWSEFARVVNRAAHLLLGHGLRHGDTFNLDRKKDMIKRAGENVSASEVEAALKDHPAVFDAAVVGIPDPVRDQAIKAYVILNEGASAGS